MLLNFLYFWVIPKTSFSSKVINKSLQRFQGVFMRKRLDEEVRLQVLQMSPQFSICDFKWSQLGQFLSPWVHYFSIIILKMWTLCLLLCAKWEMDGSCLKYAKDYRSFHDFWPTSTSHNLLNFWIFWVVQVSKCHSRDLLHSIFFGQEKIPSGRPCLDAKDYRSFLKKNLKYF